MKRNTVEAWEGELKAVFDKIDDALEEKYGRLFPLHPSRAGKGGTSNREQDGLFDVGASFSPGFGSHYGRGYVVDIDMVTLSSVPSDVRTLVYADVAEMLGRLLPEHFPDRDLRVARDGTVFKIIGDLSLGEA